MGCRRRGDPAELTRLARHPDGRLVLGSGPGRGAWVCTAECLDEASRRGALSRALRGEIPQDEIDRVRAKLMGPGWFSYQPDATKQK